MPQNGRPRTIVAMGGGGFLMGADAPLDDWLLSLTGKKRPKVCFVPTASGDGGWHITRFHEAFSAARAEATHLSLFRRQIADLKSFLLEQDLVYVAGGNTANMLAVWRLHGFHKALQAAWESGVVLAGPSAGGMCWFEGGLTDSFGPALTPIGNGLGFLSGSFCPHYSNEPSRRPEFKKRVSDGSLPRGHAADDGVALRFEGTALAEAVTARPEGKAWIVAKGTEDEIPVRAL